MSDKTPKAQNPQKRINVRSTVNTPGTIQYLNEDVFDGDFYFETDRGDGMLRIRDNQTDNVTAVYAKGAWREVWVA